MRSMSQTKEAYFLSHNGLGDNITSIGAVIFLLQYYRRIHFLCKDKYAENVKLLFANREVTVVPFDANNEYESCSSILNGVDTSNNDIFVSGVHKQYLNPHITNESILDYEMDDKYELEYPFIRQFYRDNHLDTGVYVDYFDISTTAESSAYYEPLKAYNIVFMHTQASDMTMDFSSVIHQYVNEPNHIIICADKNVYTTEHPNYQLAGKYVHLKVAHYIDIIKNATAIHVINSCFSCIVYPLYLGKKISPKGFSLYNR